MIGVVFSNTIDFVIAGAHLVEAMYEAARQAPQNPQVRASLAAGIVITRIDPRSPADIQRYFRNEGNELNDSGAVSTTFMDIYCELPEIQASWQDDRKAQRSAKMAKRRSAII